MTIIIKTIFLKIIEKTKQVSLRLSQFLISQPVRKIITQRAITRKLVEMIHNQTDSLKWQHLLESMVVRKTRMKTKRKMMWKKCSSLMICNIWTTLFIVVEIVIFRQLYLWLINKQRSTMLFPVQLSKDQRETSWFAK
jgi:hypothetical protein